MRKNVKQQLALRVLSTAALMAMVSSIATAAFADTYDLNKGSVDILAEDGKQYITQWENESKGTYATDDKGEIKKRPDDDIILTTKNKDTGETKTTSNTVTIDAKEDNTANVTLQDVHIETERSWDNSGSAPIEIKGDGDTNLELNGNNTVLSGSSKHAGIEKADVNGTGTLTIKDDLNDNGKEKSGTDATGTLVAGGCYSGAGIGGGGYHDGKSYNDTSNITITGGDITASGGTHAAGIGGGDGGTCKNIRIEGDAHVTAYAYDSGAIGSGYEPSGDSDITITDHATVEAASVEGSGIGQGINASGKATITISGHASVHAETFDYRAAIGSDTSSATVNIEDHADVTAVSHSVAIGTSYGHEYNGGTSTVINITGGTVNAVTCGKESRPAIGTVYGNLDLTINSSTGKTTVNAYTTSSDSLPLIGTADHYDSSTHKYDSISPSEGAEYNEDGSSNLGEDNAAIINSYRNTTLGTATFNAPKTLDDYSFHATYEAYGALYNAKHTLSDKNKGDLTKVVHNRKYMEEHPEIVDINKLEDEDLHDWKLVGKVVEPTLEKDGYADYICSIDKCGQTKHVVLPKIVPDTPSTPETPDTPDTPNKPDTPKQPDGTTPAPVTPDAPAQDGTAPADTPAADTTADAAATPAAAQNVVQNAKPEAAAPAAAAALPQTGANWLAVVGSALSGLFLLAAGFVLDRKGRRMN